jgi:hypothetical protein
MVDLMTERDVSKRLNLSVAWLSQAKRESRSSFT